jgi:hypothetical protein
VTDLSIIFATLGAVAGVDPSWCLPPSERRSAPTSTPESVLTS